MRPARTPPDDTQTLGQLEHRLEARHVLSVELLEAEPQRHEQQHWPPRAVRLLTQLEHVLQVDNTVHRDVHREWRHLRRRRRRCRWSRSSL
eukprot:5444699-Prymnesium_polylepis.2